MLRDRASLTASVVAAMRASEHRRRHPILVDPYARAFVEPLMHGATRLGRALDGLDALSRSGMHGYIATRHAWFDAQLQSAGPDQVLLLGAGYDTRARRFPGPTYWEVDHPATAARKHRIDPGWPAHQVPVDFERQSLVTRLQDARFVGTPRTVVIWEGVSMYLTIPAFTGTLRDLHGILPSGATLLLDALRPLDGWHPRTVGTRIGRRLMPLLGEPVRLMPTTEALDGMLTDAGWTVHERLTARQLGARYGRFVFPPATVLRCERA